LTPITAAILGEITTYMLYVVLLHTELTFSARTFPKYCYHGYCNEYIVLCHYKSLCNLLLHKFIGGNPSSNWHSNNKTGHWAGHRDVKNENYMFN